MLQFLIIITITATSSLFCNITPYLKPIEGKSSHHSMKNIDFIYMINLDERPEKFEECKRQLDMYNIYPYRFSAVNGWKLSLEQINAVGIKATPLSRRDIMSTSYLIGTDYEIQHDTIKDDTKGYFGHCMSRGAIGIVLSHLSILKDAYDSVYNTIWVMEDDIQIIKNPHTLSNMIKRLDARVGKGNWDILFTDQDTKNAQGNYVPCLSFAPRPNFSPTNPTRFSQRVNVGPYFKKIGARYGAYSMIIRRSGIEKILQFYNTHQIYFPYDMDFFLPDTIQLYTLRNDVVSTKINALSDNGKPTYKKSTAPISKEEIFNAMSQLEGWCSKEKASILIDIIQKNKMQTVVEIGVWGGKSLIPMAFALQNIGTGQVYGIDPWSSEASTIGMDGANHSWWSQVDHDCIYQGLINKIAQFNLERYISLIRSTSENAAPIHNIDLLHIDGNHSEEASYIDVTKWVPYLKSGGYVVFDDINWRTTGKAVTWLNENCVKIAEHTGDNIWGIWQKQ